MSIEFDQAPGSEDTEQIVDWVRDQLNKVEDLINSGARELKLVPIYAEPDKVTDGLIVYADGTSWNPGSGEGPYMYYNSQWNFLAAVDT